MFPSLLGEPFPLLAYPLEMVLAEKLVTMIERGVTNTRERDFADVVMLCGRHAVDATDLLAAILATAEHRQQQISPLRDALRPLGERRQGDWAAFTGRSGLGDGLPASYTVVIEHVADFADPLLDGSVAVGRWDPVERRWKP